MGKIILYRCDWCGLELSPDGTEDWPKNWSNFDELGNDDLLCDGCMAAGRTHIEKALEAAKSFRQRIGAEYAASSTPTRSEKAEDER